MLEATARGIVYDAHSRALQDSRLLIVANYGKFWSQTHTRTRDFLVKKKEKNTHTRARYRGEPEGDQKAGTDRPRLNSMARRRREKKRKKKQQD